MGTVVVLLLLAVALLVGLICFFFAKEKGQNPHKWFATGFLGSLFAGTIIMSIDKKVREKKAKR